MSDRIYLRVVDIIGSSLCISLEDGQKVFNEIDPLLKSGQQITISFERVTMLTALFFNVTIGQLYGSFTEEHIYALVKVDGLAKDDVEMLKRVVDNAKRYFANAESYDAAWESVGS